MKGRAKLKKVMGNLGKGRKVIGKQKIKNPLSIGHK